PGRERLALLTLAVQRFARIVHISACIADLEASSTGTCNLRAFTPLPMNEVADRIRRGGGICAAVAIVAALEECHTLAVLTSPALALRKGKVLRGRWPGCAGFARSDLSLECSVKACIKEEERYGVNTGCRSRGRWHQPCVQSCNACVKLCTVEFCRPVHEGRF